MPQLFHVELSLDRIRRSRNARRGGHVIDTDKRIIRQIQDLIRLSGMEVKNQVLLDMLSPKHGLHYPQLPYQSSAPGEVPSYQSGTLFNSITIKTSRNGLSIVMDVTAPYAKYLMGGLKGEWNARPILEPAASRVQEIFKANLRNILRVN